LDEVRNTINQDLTYGQKETVSSEIIKTCETSEKTKSAIQNSFEKRAEMQKLKSKNLLQSSRLVSRIA
jgi:hypothetical protein